MFSNAPMWNRKNKRYKATTLSSTAVANAISISRQEENNIILHDSNLAATTGDGQW